MPVTASIRRTPAEMPCSLMILNSPISPVRGHMQTAHSSMENGLPSLSVVPMDSTRTVSPYFFAKEHHRPFVLALSMSKISTWAGVLANICWFTMVSIWLMFCSVNGLSYEKSKRSKSLLTIEPFWLTPSPNMVRKAAVANEWQSGFGTGRTHLTCHLGGR